MIYKLSSRNCVNFRYSYHFPELIKIVPEIALYAKCVKVCNRCVYKGLLLLDIIEIFWKKKTGVFFYYNLQANQIATFLCVGDQEQKGVDCRQAGYIGEHCHGLGESTGDKHKQFQHAFRPKIHSKLTLVLVQMRESDNSSFN